jgi:uncharacterized protein YdiU (UPF0061 family)
MRVEEMEFEYDYLNLDPLFYHRVNPQGLKEPFLIDVNTELLKELGIDESEAGSEEFVKFVNGEHLVKNSKPFAMVYAGHQFGYFVDRLGDGRAINLGKFKGYNFQLKGSGLTRYSRDGDGRAVLRSSIREYLVSEAMHYLGVPTTRALALIGSNHRVYRGEWESGAIVLRLSPSWIRFGSFEYFYYKRRYDLLKDLVDFTIRESFPRLIGDRDGYKKMFDEVVKKTAILFAKWMSLGFVHGVLNSDNTSIAGLTIDYGPFGFMDEYDANFTPNLTDREGRYSFKNQPQIGYINLSMLATALSPLIDKESLIESLESYEEIFNEANLNFLREKLGLEKREKSDSYLISKLFDLLQRDRVDYTLFFRRLSEYKGDRAEIFKLFVSKESAKKWFDLYDERLKKEKRDEISRLSLMKLVNPKYILRNYMLQEAIDSAKNGDFSLVKDLMELIKTPFNENFKFDRYSKPPTQNHKNIQLSCSS